MTEADYRVPSIEIASLYPMGREEARTQILNEWNENDLLSNSEEDEEESSIDANSSEYGSTHKDSSFHTACWGCLGDKEDIGCDESEATLQAEEKISDVDGKNGSNGSVTVYIDANDANDKEEEYHDTWDGENTLFISNKDTSVRFLLQVQCCKPNNTSSGARFTFSMRN